MGTIMKTISIIIPITGKWRGNNLSTCLHFLNKQSYKDFEIILVEQINCKIGNQQSPEKFYCNAPVDKYIAITNKINYEFNQPWMANVGAKISSGKKLLFFDGDLLVRHCYLETLSKLDEPFIYAWDKCFHLSQTISNKIIKRKKLIMNNYTEEHRPAVRGHEGYAICIDRDFFFNKLGCYNENLFGWGGNDNEVAARARNILRIKPLKALREPLFHLWHPRNYTRSTNTGFVMAARFFPRDVTKRLLNNINKLGNPKSPKIISIKDIIKKAHKKKFGR
jgi:predicted glycosyltransferase involved in capsule biosynthesis